MRLRRFLGLLAIVGGCFDLPVRADMPALRAPVPVDTPQARTRLFTAVDLAGAFPGAQQKLGAEEFIHVEGPDGWWRYFATSQGLSIGSTFMARESSKAAGLTFDMLARESSLPGSQDWSSRVHLGQQCHAVYLSSAQGPMLLLQVRVGSHVLDLRTLGFAYGSPQQIVDIVEPWVRRSSVAE